MSRLALREPAFWWREAGAASALLAPIAALYGGIAGRRMRRAGTRAAAPVICIGNFTLGGTGKTPTAIAVAQLLAEAGETPALLSRGYGGQFAGPVQVDASRHRAAEVGDEPLLLARAAPTIIARDRVAGARAATATGATVIVMDDGLQNPSLEKDLSIVVVDARRGLGNGKVFPGGPLRAPLDMQFTRADAVLLVGPPGDAASVTGSAARHAVPVFHATLEPDAAAVTALRGKRTLVFAGIGDPDKFFATVTAAGLDAALRRPFPDHHRYSHDDAAALIADAKRQGLTLLTTEKDLARMSGDPALAALARHTIALPVRLTVHEKDAWRALILAALTQTRGRAQMSS
jgi:tetraacyldisaccharide 4'-kinase